MPPKPQYKPTSFQTQGFVMDDSWKSSDSDGDSDGPAKMFTMDDDLDEPSELNPYELSRKLRALKIQRDMEEIKEQTEKAESSTKTATAHNARAGSFDATKGPRHARQKSNKSNERQENQDPGRARHPHAGYKKVLEEYCDHSPDSEVIESGFCTPQSEGVWRADRKDVAHWPAELEEKAKDAKRADSKFGK